MKYKEKNEKKTKKNGKNESNTNRIINLQKKTHNIDIFCKALRRTNAFTYTTVRTLAAQLTIVMLLVTIFALPAIHTPTNILSDELFTNRVIFAGTRTAKVISIQTVVSSEAKQTLALIRGGFMKISNLGSKIPDFV